MMRTVSNSKKDKVMPKQNNHKDIKKNRNNQAT